MGWLDIAVKGGVVKISEQVSTDDYTGFLRPRPNALSVPNQSCHSFSQIFFGLLGCQVKSSLLVWPGCGPGPAPRPPPTCLLNFPSGSGLRLGPPGFCNGSNSWEEVVRLIPLLRSARARDLPPLPSGAHVFQWLGRPLPLACSELSSAAFL